MTLTEKALIIAENAHKGQIGKDGHPYIHHPVAVADTVETELEKAVALLHDVVEDTAVTLDDLSAEGFPPEVVEAVRLLSKPAEADYFEYLAQVKENPLAKAVKLADLAHNMDLTRLPEVTAKDRERAEKYQRARTFLLDDLKG